MARQPTVAAPTVERKILFFRVDAGLDDAGVPVPFDVAPVLRYVNRLPFGDDGRYLAGMDGNVTCCWVDGVDTSPRLRLATLRRSALPQIEEGGRLSRLVIPSTSGLAESIHIVFFPNQIAGADFNFYGPRASRLAHYFARKANGICPPVTFEPLLRQDIAEQLDRLEDVRLFQLKIRRSFAEAVAEADQDLGSAFRAAADAGEAEELEIILRPRRHSRGRLAQRLLGVARRLVHQDDLRTEASRFLIKGLDSETDRIALVDVLSDKLISRKAMVLAGARTRAITPESAYAGIQQAYRELRDDLLLAAGVRP